MLGWKSGALGFSDFCVSPSGCGVVGFADAPRWPLAPFTGISFCKRLVVLIYAEYATLLTRLNA